MIYDALIIGSGIIGCAVAQALSHYKINALVLEKANDVCEGTTKANSAIIHVGFDAKPGTLKAKYNVIGSMMFPRLANMLDIDYKTNGALVICKKNDDVRTLHELLRRGNVNGINQLGIINSNEIKMIEPNISENVVAALTAPTSRIVCPFTYNIALAENAADNGVEFQFGCEVVSIRKEGELFKVETDGRKVFTSRFVVNAAGVWADDVHNMICPDKIKIIPRRGEYLVLDRMDDYVRRTIFPLPTKMGKGIVITPTVHGNVLFGPTAEDVQDKYNTKTTTDGRKKILENVEGVMKTIPKNKIINSFSGLRAHETNGDFIVGENQFVNGFVDCAGIESPGLSAAPAIGLEVANLIKEKLGLEEKQGFVKKRKGIVRIGKLKKLEYKYIASKNPEYAKIICKCNRISLAEIKDSINRTLGAVSLDGIKRRTFALMGRCQGSNCIDKISQILAEERKIDLNDITKKGGNSYQFERDEDGKD